MVNPFAIGPHSGLLVPFIREKRRQVITLDALVGPAVHDIVLPSCNHTLRTCVFIEFFIVILIFFSQYDCMQSRMRCNLGGGLC